MFVLHLNFGRHKKACIILTVLAVLIAAACVTATIRLTQRPKQVLDSGGRQISLKLESGADFVKSLGLEANGDAEVKRVTIPSQFNEAYESYNALQQSVGLDLKPYSGKSAEMITVPLKGEKPRYAVILAVDGTVVGGHITDGEYGGELAPLF